MPIASGTVSTDLLMATPVTRPQENTAGRDGAKRRAPSIKPARSAGAKRCQRRNHTGGCREVMSEEAGAMRPGAEGRPGRLPPQDAAGTLAL
ncbi:protein of unknown function [Cupriavidus taiwanensis]|uniref:Uncharacterized protein n=1 Tax=Cupriavidus taiwanensis TaxID=164546 RepID=A0A375IJG9_9BURK|nr:protein of unknown function [Cupriavidus taiwanensis]